MEISPRATAALALVALVPLGVYAGLSGELTAVTAVIGALNVVLVAVSLILMLGPAPGETPEQGNGTTH